ncbi:hypothetical protein ACKWTF_004936 [Chironomus riparius]
MSDQQSYIYHIEFSIENVKIFPFPPELEYLDELDYLIRFEMIPDISMEITETEFIDNVNCNELPKKSVVFTMNDQQLNSDPKACITAYKIKCPKDIISVGCYDFPNFQCKLKEVKKKFDCHNKGNNNIVIPEFIKEFSLIVDCNGKGTGSIHYIIRINCYGSAVNMGFSEKQFSDLCDKYKTDDDGYGRIKGCTFKTEKAEDECILTCPNDDHDSQFDEYMAQVNGNQLIVRVAKGYSVKVSDALSENNKHKLTIRGCDQQIDFNFPQNFTCCHCRKKYGNCKCKGDSDLTDYQRKTSCSGSSYKNSATLPVIRGNLKYPGRFEDQKVKFDVQNYCEPVDATEKYRMKSQMSRAVCLQADQENFTCELNGMSKVPQGIQLCRAGCEDDVDVFVWKISEKRTDRNGKKNIIELELRTPRGPRIEIPKKETREVQVLEDEFEEMKKLVKKDVVGQKNGVGKLNEKSAPKTLVKNGKAQSIPAKSIKAPGNPSISKKLSVKNDPCKKKTTCK